MTLPKHLASNSTATLVFIVLSFLTSAAALPASNITLMPRVHNASGNSLNWSGYAVTGSSGSVSDVKASWIVPQIQGSCTATNQYSSFWVGIDGYNSGTVEQTGTDSDCQNGAATYYAWYEFYPHPSFLINGLTIRPGDHISAEASFNGKSFTVRITDTTTGHSSSTSAKVRGAARSSAEWIAEAPSSNSGILPLANFGTVSYGTDNTGIANTCYATVGGTTGPIGAFGSSVQQITMVANSGAVKAQPSTLSSDGTSFSVTWTSAGP
jgi:Peptidase A4 family